MLFIFDPKTQTVTEQHEVMPIKYGGTIWSDAFLVTAKDGNVYGTARDVFFRIDGETKKVTILDSARKFSNLTQDKNGDLYMRSGIAGKEHELWTYTNPDLALAKLQQHVEAYGNDGSLAQPLYAQTSNDVKQAVHHWDGGRREQAVHFLNKTLSSLEDGGKWASEAVRAKLLLEAKAALDLVERK